MRAGHGKGRLWNCQHRVIDCEVDIGIVTGIPGVYLSLTDALVQLGVDR